MGATWICGDVPIFLPVCYNNYYGTRRFWTNSWRRQSRRKVYWLGRVWFQLSAYDKILVTVLRGSKDAIWSISELPEMLSYVLSSACCDDMEIMPRTTKKKVVDPSHMRRTYMYLVGHCVRRGERFASDRTCRSVDMNHKTRTFSVTSGDLYVKLLTAWRSRMSLILSTRIVKITSLLSGPSDDLSREYFV